METKYKTEADGPQQWESVGDEVVAAILEKLKSALQKASESIYEDLPYTAQEYLIDNVRWNIRSTIDAAERQALHDRMKLTALIEHVKGIREYVDDVAAGHLVSASGHDLRAAAKDDIKAIDKAIHGASL